MMFDIATGKPLFTAEQQKAIAAMGSPVRCRCGQIYDLQAVEVTARYSDATVFRTPCCRRQADDREWKGSPDFTRIDKREVLGR